MMHFASRGLKNIFKVNHVIAAYLFGSRARGNPGPLSDMDIAVYVDSDKMRTGFFNLRLKLLGALNDFFRTDRIDLVILNEAPPLLAHRILRDGKVVFCGNHRRRQDYEVKAVLEYLDWQPRLERYLREILRAA